ncbi:MAG: DUF4870 domain-containing protein [Pseudomonadota bacterium]
MRTPNREWRTALAQAPIRSPGRPLAGLNPTKDERTWALLAHLSALAGFVIPFGNLLGPLVVWQVKKSEMPFVDDQGKEALNFQITVSIAVIICFVLMLVLIGALLLFVVGIAALALAVIAALKANDGEYYRYPVSWRIVK